MLKSGATCTIIGRKGGSMRNFIMLCLMSGLCLSAGPANAALIRTTELEASAPEARDIIRIAKFKKDKKRTSSFSKSKNRKKLKKRNQASHKKKAKTRARDKRNTATGLLDDSSHRDRRLKRKPRSFSRKDKLDLIDGRRYYQLDGYHRKKRSQESFKKN